MAEKTGENCRYVIKIDLGTWAVKKPGAERASSLHDIGGRRVPYSGAQIRD